MKKMIAVLALAAPLLFSCEKDDKGGGAAVNYSGTYKGTISIQTNGTASGTLSDYSITFTETGGGNMQLTNSVFAAFQGKVAGNVFTLNKKIIASAPSFNTEQTGTAVFTSTSTVISFKEQEIDNSNGAVLNTKTWTGTLIKQ